jgi:hypothetical protein
VDVEVDELGHGLFFFAGGTAAGAEYPALGTGGSMAPDAAACVAASAAWYRAMFRAHGLPWEEEDGLLVRRGPVPPFHSSAVTLGERDAGALADRVGALRGEIAGPFTVKDSFAALDLGPAGFRVLFEAEWIALDAGAAAPPGPASGASWSPVRSLAALEGWEAAWRENGSPAASRVFPPALLDGGGVALLAARRHDRLVGGCAVHRLPGAAGFSNFFAEDSDPGPLLAAAIAEARRCAPGVPLLGYDRGDALAAHLRLGFRSVGRLRVWETA